MLSIGWFAVQVRRGYFIYCLFDKCLLLLFYLFFLFQLCLLCLTENRNVGPFGNKAFVKNFAACFLTLVYVSRFTGRVLRRYKQAFMNHSYKTGQQYFYIFKSSSE